jgi:hypothetical protein
MFLQPDPNEEDKTSLAISLQASRNNVRDTISNSASRCQNSFALISRSTRHHYKFSAPCDDLPSTMVPKICLEGTKEPLITRKRRRACIHHRTALARPMVDS